MTQCCNNCSTLKEFKNARINIKNFILCATLLLLFATPTTICSTSSYDSGNGQEQPQPQQQNSQQIPLVRLPSNTLLKYTAYKDVSILHFRVPWDARTALFTFKAYEETKGAFRKFCFLIIFLSIFFYLQMKLFAVVKN